MRPFAMLDADVTLIDIFLIRDDAAAADVATLSLMLLAALMPRLL